MNLCLPCEPPIDKVQDKTWRFSRRFLYPNRTIKHQLFSSPPPLIPCQCPRTSADISSDRSRFSLPVGWNVPEFVFSPLALDCLGCHNSRAEATLWPLGPAVFFPVSKGCQLRSGSRGTQTQHSQMPKERKSYQHAQLDLLLRLLLQKENRPAGLAHSDHRTSVCSESTTLVEFVSWPDHIVVLNWRHCILKLNKNEKVCFQKDFETQGMGNVKVTDQRWFFWVISLI